MELAIKILTVIGLGAFELWAAIPTGFALQLHPVLVSFAAALGAGLSALVVILLGGRLRVLLLRHHDSKTHKKGKPGLIDKIWQRYGVIGLGLVAPLLTGAPIGAALGLALGIPASRLFLWLSLGIVLSSIVLTLTGTVVMAIFRH
jgi:uncharacterized membrane protein